jgi:hypothetical protein
MCPSSLLQFGIGSCDRCHKLTFVYPIIFWTPLKVCEESGSGRITEEALGKTANAPQGRRSLEGAGLVCIEDGWASPSICTRPPVEAAPPYDAPQSRTVPLQAASVQKKRCSTVWADYEECNGAKKHLVTGVSLQLTQGCRGDLSPLDERYIGGSDHEEMVSPCRQG